MRIIRCVLGFQCNDGMDGCHYLPRPGQLTLFEAYSNIPAGFTALIGIHSYFQGDTPSVRPIRYMRCMWELIVHLESILQVGYHYPVQNIVTWCAPFNTSHVVVFLVTTADLMPVFLPGAL